MSQSWDAKRLAAILNRLTKLTDHESGAGLDIVLVNSHLMAADINQLLKAPNIDISIRVYVWLYSPIIQ